MITDTKPERLDKLLSNAGYGSRAVIKKLIRSGAVSCNGNVVDRPEEKYVFDDVLIEIEGVRLNITRHIYLMMNKPEGFLSATYDPRHRTIIELLPDYYRARDPFPVGRLDIDTTGLMLLTDDGAFAHRLTSPKRHVEKEYVAILDKMPGEDVVNDFERGMTIDNETVLRPAKLIIPTLRQFSQARLLPQLQPPQPPLSQTEQAQPPSKTEQAQLPSQSESAPQQPSQSESAPQQPSLQPPSPSESAPQSQQSQPPPPISRQESAPPFTRRGARRGAESAQTMPEGGFFVKVILTEGKFHQIKRMFEAHGITVLHLKRVRIGALVLDPSLAPGELRELTPSELSSLAE